MPPKLQSKGIHMVPGRKTLISPDHPSYKWWLTATLVVGSMTVGFAERMIEIAIPQIMVALRVNLDQAQWIRTGPAIVRTILGPTVGWLSSIFGIRQIYVATIVLFIVGSGFAGAAWSFGTLIFFLALKNAGGGLRQPLSMSILYRSFPPHQRGLAMGFYQASHMMGPLFAPVLAGWLVENFGWRSVFYINIPINLLALLLVMAVMPKDLDAQEKKRPPSVDFLGLASMGTCLSTLLWAVNNGQTLGWDSPQIMSLFSISAIAGSLFVITELNSEYPIVELRVFKNISFTLSFLVRLFNTGIFFSTNFIFGIFIQRELKFTPLQAGQRLMPMAFASGVGGIFWGYISDKIRIPTVISISLLASSITMYLYSMMELGTSLTFIIAVTIFQALFRSGSQATMIRLSLSTLPSDKVTLGAGLDSLARNLGNTIGVPLITAFVTKRQSVRLAGHMRTHTVNPESNQALNSLQRALEQAGEPPARARMSSLRILRDQITQRATIESFHDGYRLAALTGIFLIPLVLMIRSIHDEGRIRRGGAHGQGGTAEGGTSNIEQSNIKESQSNDSSKQGNP
ncbi:MAG: DHA2 family efflux MFS transporter permease subunit [Deltaproteobacteria bacterium]|nr:DHA2 family efflux MFS transporter permease subunit [Deltaproteobacteria bacterium]